MRLGNWSIAHTNVFSGPLDTTPGSLTILTDEKVSLPIGLVTDATSTPDNKKILARSYAYNILYTTSERVRIVDVLNYETPCRAPLVNELQQGESIALTPDGTSYYVHSEGVGQDLVKFEFY